VIKSVKYKNPLGIKRMKIYKSVRNH